MESMKHKLGIVLLVLCLLGVAAVVCYLLLTLPGGEVMDGTLVKIAGGMRML